MSDKRHFRDIVDHVWRVYDSVMSYVYYNPNPERRDGIDCVVRAISKVADVDWLAAYRSVCLQGELSYDMPSANHVWGSLLRKMGFRRVGLPNSCPDCYTVSDFAIDHPKGRYVLATNGHVVALVNGLYYDNFDSGDRVVDFYWYKEA